MFQKSFTFVKIVFLQVKKLFQKHILKQILAIIVSVFLIIYQENDIRRKNFKMNLNNTLRESSRTGGLNLSKKGENIDDPFLT